MRLQNMIFTTLVVAALVFSLSMTASAQTATPGSVPGPEAAPIPLEARQKCINDSRLTVLRAKIRGYNITNDRRCIAPKPFAEIDYVGVEALPMGNLGDNEFAIEYHTRLGDHIGVFGFLEDGNNRLSFQKHIITATPAPKKAGFIASRTEIGGDSSAKFIRTGGSANLIKLPKVGAQATKVFNFASLSYVRKLAGGGVKDEVSLAWATKPLKIGPAKISSESFYNLHANGNFGQHQLLIKVPKWSEKISFVWEAEVVGTRTSSHFGFKWMWVKED